MTCNNNVNQTSNTNLFLIKFSTKEQPIAFHNDIPIGKCEFTGCHWPKNAIHQTTTCWGFFKTSIIFVMIILNFFCPEQKDNIQMNGSAVMQILWVDKSRIIARTLYLKYCAIHDEQISTRQYKPAGWENDLDDEQHGFWRGHQSQCWYVLYCI